MKRPNVVSIVLIYVVFMMKLSFAEDDSSCEEMSLQQSSVSTPIVEILDNSDPATLFTQGWTLQSFQADQYGTDYHVVDRGIQLETATYVFDVTCAGLYRLSEWHPSMHNGAYDAKLTINHALGSSQESINQHVSSGKWNSVGTYQFFRGKYEIILSNNASLGISVMADAFKLEMVDMIGDLNGDAKVDEKDLKFLLDGFHTHRTRDCNGDGYVDSLDIWSLSQNWSFEKN